MKAALNTVVWDILWRNRLVFPVLALLLALAAGLAWATSMAPPDAWWVKPAGPITAVAFVASLFLGVAPFTLMESQGGWRMNSMITRWFVLPVRTFYLVLLPVLAGAGFMALLIAAWMPVLNRVAQGFDGLYFGAVLAVGIVALQAVAWTVPRKPSQFWTVAAILFPVVLMLSTVPQDQPGREQFRYGMLVPLSYATVLLFAFAWYAARRNRCGDWAGELPIDRLWMFLRQGGAKRLRHRDFHSSATALFWSDTLPPLRLLVFSWLSFVLVVFGYCLLTVPRDHPELPWTPRLMAVIGLSLFPVAAVIWMAVWGLFVGSEPASGFRTRLSSFRATLPVSCGTLAAQRLTTVLLGWTMIWLPLLGLSAWYDPTLAGMPSAEAMAAMRAVLARLMTLGAQVVVGALPLFLLGRFEGFPNLLLASMGSWLWAAALASFVRVDDEPGWRWGVVAALVLAKLGVAAWAFARGLRHGHLTWRFVATVVAGWLALTGSLIWLLPTWRTGGAWASAAVVLLMPLARIALCPLAVAANRHR